jgi:uncharacterized protein YndB with AHSA1/START domain
MALHYKVSTRIPRPVEEAFDHVVEPALLSSYFTSDASGPLEAGKTVRWTWAGGESETLDVGAVERNRRIEFRWKAAYVDVVTTVVIAFAPDGPEACNVTIEESGWPDALGENARSAFEQCAGWQRMLLCMKARMKFGIDLRG